ncbi:hypothetical protein L484_027678 [Morus notabilis]|uniref:Uncharacterized protein n=1 Tax=Morus notabilis TaxID=981085 RepID=W9RCG9_9ROSA|nr:hypothetical protein L484_027678 [Morus notabilis]
MFKEHPNHPMHGSQKGENSAMRRWARLWNHKDGPNYPTHHKGAQSPLTVPQLLTKITAVSPTRPHRA